MKRELSIYDFNAYFLPGAILVAGLLFLDQSFVQSIAKREKEISFGDLGIFAILCYVSGFLVASMGSAIEQIYWWFWGGRPSVWIAIERRRSSLLSHHLLQKAYNSIKSQIISNAPEMKYENRKDWQDMIRAMYTIVAEENRSARVDIFNANYALSRNSTASFVIISIAAMIPEMHSLHIGVTSVILMVLSLIRMHRFGISYTREIILQFIRIDDKSTIPKKPV